MDFRKFTVLAACITVATLLTTGCGEKRDLGQASQHQSEAGSDRISSCLTGDRSGQAGLGGSASASFDCPRNGCSSRSIPQPLAEEETDWHVQRFQCHHHGTSDFNGTRPGPVLVRFSHG